MKKLLVVLVMLVGLTALAIAQKAESLIEFKLKNTSLLPKKITVITYQPGEAGNGTQGMLLGPLSTKTLAFREGTKIYLANDKQVDVVMSGKRIDQDKPFLTLAKESRGKTFIF
jgi:hypothetical protein